MAKHNQPGKVAKPATNPQAYLQSFGNQRYTGEIPQTPDHYIKAQLVGESRPTFIEFPPSKLEAMKEKYPNGLIYLKNRPVNV